MLLLAVAACEQGKKAHPAPPPPTPTGVLRGRVTATINGPGRKHAAEESFSRSNGLECNVVAIDRSGNTFEAKTTSEGTYEMTVPVGHYEVSFNACHEDRSCNVPVPTPIEVGAGSAAAADWDCQMDAK